MENIPTVEEIMDKVAKSHGMGKLVTGHSISLFREAMIEFAKLHVQAALKAANKGIEYNSEYDSEWNLCTVTINEESILNAYPLENIK